MNVPTVSHPLLTRTLHLVLAVTALLCLSLTGPAGAATPLTELVTDPHQSLSEPEQDQLVQKLTDLRQTLPSHPHILIVLPGHVDDIDQYANETFHASGIGQKGQDNGLLIVLDIPDNQARIEVGYGFEGDLTDLQTFNILHAAQPNLKAGHYAAALNGILDSIADILRKSETQVHEEQATSDTDFNINGFDLALGVGGMVLFALGSGFTVRAQRREAQGLPLSIFDRFLISIPWDVILSLLINILSAASRNNANSSGGDKKKNSYKSGGGDSGGGGAKDSW
ncbi:TPM domain-containing protein [Gluconobacter cerinus]|uniref:TPM domain-containing protein n=1 Tax=Gluconobacter TaxID=441 RepID=UPI001B8BEEAA|nr:MULTISPECIES: TPM domain-containing protein [Gluconobacter]MBS0993934.1 TPM domain-containing protein [Gluconobacter cerinus]MBS1020826.1 TPM domain-containing protein [Gluconobacter cerinus]